MDKNIRNEWTGLSVEELMELVEQKKISWSEWVEAQLDTYPDYDEWLVANGRERNDESALAFIRETEEECMENGYGQDVHECMQVAESYRRMG